MNTYVLPYLKAFVGALVAALSVLATSLDNGELNAQEVIYALIAFLTAFGAVWAVPNKDPEAQHQRDSVQPPNA